MASLGVENAAYHESNNVHRMNNCEGTDKQRLRIVETDREEKMSGKYFMKRVKERWGNKFQRV